MAKIKGDVLFDVYDAGRGVSYIVGGEQVAPGIFVLNDRDRTICYIPKGARPIIREINEGRERRPMYYVVKFGLNAIAVNPELFTKLGITSLVIGDSEFTPDARSVSSVTREALRRVVEEVKRNKRPSVQLAPFSAVAIAFSPSTLVDTIASFISSSASIYHNIISETVERFIRAESELLKSKATYEVAKSRASAARVFAVGLVIFLLIVGAILATNYLKQLKVPHPTGHLPYPAGHTAHHATPAKSATATKAKSIHVNATQVLPPPVKTGGGRK